MMGGGSHQEATSCKSWPGMVDDVDVSIRSSAKLQLFSQTADFRGYENERSSQIGEMEIDEKMLEATYLFS
jgi:hypothetical protein